MKNENENITLAGNAFHSGERFAALKVESKRFVRDFEISTMNNVSCFFYRPIKKMTEGI